jgi:alpha-1,2-mannosyltransferase
VEFVVNQPFSTILSCLQESWLGLHTMEAEHFGISVVEMLAAGLLVVAHNSAGPKMDIICE